jgi:hypothetical protein
MGPLSVPRISNFGTLEHMYSHQYFNGVQSQNDMFTYTCMHEVCQNVGHERFDGVTSP